MTAVEKVRIKRVVLQGFRNHRLTQIEPGDGITILVGPNAAGKTNILEAISLTTRVSSFRQFSWTDVVARDSEMASVRIDAFRGDSPVEMVLSVEKNGQKSHSVNGTKKRRLTDVIGRVPTVTFVPDDLQLAKGSAEVRRTALDTLGGQLSGAYATLRSEYQRIVRQRNALLKQQPSAVELDAWNERLAEVGSAFFMHRARLAARVSPKMKKFHERLAPGEELAVFLECSWGGNPAEPEEYAAISREEVYSRLVKEMERVAGAERERRVTLVGPHRDDLLFTVDGLPARAFASQGQQRSLALAWKMAEVAVVGDVSGFEPVLLLDDVMSELDEKRRAALQDFVDTGPQTLFTTTNLSYFTGNGISDAHVVEVGGSE